MARRAHATRPSSIRNALTAPFFSRRTRLGSRDGALGGRRGVHVGLALWLVAAGWGCTTVTASAVKSERQAGITRNYSRSPAELYEAAVLGLESLRATPEWRDLEITERDPAQGTVIAERDMNSAIIPGLGERDAIGIFVAETSDGDSAVTVVRMSSDQFPGSTGTTVNTARDASGLLFPAIDQALASIPEQPRTRVAAAPSTDRPARSAAPAVVTPPSGSVAQRPATAAPASTGAALIDRVYDTLRASGSWRPLVRELTANGDEEIRVGAWAVLTAAADRVLLRVKAKDGSPVDAARLALDLQRAGFEVDVQAAASR